MERDGEYLFEPLIPLCHVSSSQEERLQSCPFATEPYDRRDNDDAPSPEDYGGEIRIASTPIMMISLPESEEEEDAIAAAGNSREDEFVTPPEEVAVSSSGEFRPAADCFGYDSGSDCGSVVQVVDLSRGSDLGFLAVEAVHRGNADLDAIRLKSDVRVVLVETMDLNRLNSQVEVVRKENLGSSPVNCGDEMMNLNRLNSKVEVAQKENLDSIQVNLGDEMVNFNRLNSEVEVARKENLDSIPVNFGEEMVNLNLEVEVAQKENLDSIPVNFGDEMAQRQNLVSETKESKPELEGSQRGNLDSEGNRSSPEIELTQRENQKVDLSQSKQEVRYTDLKAVLEGIQRENLDSEANRLILETELTQRENPKVDPSQSEPEAPKTDSKSELGVSQRENIDSETSRSSPEVELTRMEIRKVDPSQSNPKVPETDSSGTRVLTRELSLKAGLGESPLKKLKVSEQNSEEPNEESEVLGAIQTENSFDFHRKAEIDINRSSPKRKLELSDHPIASETVRSAQELIGAEAVVAVKLRRLPSLILGRPENVEKPEFDEGCNEVTIFDVLNLLTGDPIEDETPNSSFLEICKGRGMVFAKTGFGGKEMDVQSFEEPWKVKRGCKIDT